MKSILIKTLAAASLVAAAQAQVHVLGAVWKERGLSAPDGEIDRNFRTVAAPRAYLVFDQSIITAAPGPATLITYTSVRTDGVTTKSYTIDSQFRAFTVDTVEGPSGGKRLYGHIHAPLTLAEVPGSMIPFEGTPFGSGYPKSLHFDAMVFQNGSTTGLTGPRLDLDGTIFRSHLSGSASNVNVVATTIGGANGAVAELEARLVNAGYFRGAVAPVIVTNLPPTLAIQDGDVETLSVGLGPNVFPTPTYKWFRNNVQTAVTTPTFNVVGGATSPTGAGTYRVEVTTGAGTAVSSDVVVTPLQYTFATNLPAAVPILGANSTDLSVVLDPVPITNPTYQWFRATLVNPAVFTPIPAGIGGTLPTLTVIGGEAATGAGVYKLEVTSTAGIATSASSTVTVTTTIPANTLAFTTNIPRTATPTSTGTFVLNPTIANPGTGVTFRWFKAPLANPTAFVIVENGDGGDIEDLSVTGLNDHPRGPGVYRLVVTRVAAPGATITSISTTVTTAP